MTLFVYETRDAAGQPVRGELEATDSARAAAALRELGLVPVRIQAGTSRPKTNTDAAISGPAAAAGPGPLGMPMAATAASTSPAAGASVRPKPAGQGPWRGLRKLWLRARGLPEETARVNETELQLLTRELYAMVKAGVTLTRALEILTQSTTNPDLSAALTRVGQTLGNGLDFSTALERETARTGVFSSFYVSLIRVGETTGRLEECLQGLAQHLQFLRATREQLQAALRYPLFVLMAAAAAVGVINLFVIPQFEKVFRGLNAELPVLTQLLMHTSAFFVTFWPLMLIAGVAGFVGLSRWLATPAGAARWSHWQLRLPIVGELAHMTCVARFCTSFAIALRSGVPLTQGLGVVSETIGNARFTNAVREMRVHVERGDPVRVAAAKVGIFPPALLQVIAVGEETGALGELLLDMGNHYRSDVEYQLSRLSARLEPLLIAGLGLVVLVLALGVFLPIWELGRAAR